MKVKFQVTETMRYYGEIDLTKEEYENWCDRIDNARGFEVETLAEELVNLAGIDRLRDGNPEDAQVDDFYAEEDA